MVDTISALYHASEHQHRTLTIRQVCRNVKRWRDARMALRWTAAGMLEAGKGFRRLNACKQLPVLKAALEKHRDPQAGAPVDSMTQAV